MKRKGQVTVFVIIGIMIIAALATFFIFKSSIGEERVPTYAEPIKTKFIQCLEDDISSGISFIGANGGYLFSPEFVAGNRLNPTSSKLSFAGLEIPYWSYLSASSFAKEQLPTISLMENQLADFLELRIMQCDFDEFREDGYIIKMENPSVLVSISEDFVDVDVNLDLSVEKDSDMILLNEHSLRYNSRLGYLFDMSMKLYEKQKTEMFLENYGVDTLRLYLPVDGVELTCSPLVWNAEVLYGELKDALEVNTMAIKNNGKDNDYFVIDFSEDVTTRFIYSKDWPTYFEVSPTESGTMISEPVGNERGMGILGFCYVPYHYVYNVKYPVLIQVEKDSEIFQFPVVSSIEGNLPREKRLGDVEVEEQIDMCQYKNTEFRVNLYDSDLNSIDGNISFECFGSRCEIGETVNGELKENFPQCVNGIVSVSSNGFRNKDVVYSTVENGSLMIVMDREYEKNVELDFSGPYLGRAIISFSNDDYSQSIVFPEQKSINLAKGTYDVNVMLYSDSEIQFPESEKEQCYDVPRSGVLGLAGLKTKECSTIILPAQKLSSALIGGGNTEVIINENQLFTSNSIVLVGDKLKTPTSLQELQENYVQIETSSLGVEFR